MNRKNIIGPILTLLGLGGLISVAVWFLNSSKEANNESALVILGTLSFVSFMIGINLVSTTKHTA
jgi:hypothetical protein